MNCLQTFALVGCVLIGPLSDSFLSAAELPQDQAWQRELRGFLQTLTEQDFEHGVTSSVTAVEGDQGDDAEWQYRNYLLTLMNQPLVGTKRGMPAINAPARLFVLSSIERPDAVYVPPVWADTLMPFVQWKYPGNPYFDNRALKLRAFVAASVNLMMLDDYLTHTPESGGARAALLAYHLVTAGSPYPGFRDELPPSVQAAYQAGVRRLAERMLIWGPTGEHPNMELIGPVGLWYASQVLDDADFTRRAEAYARRLFTDPQFFHPAGYFVDHGGVDAGYSGMSNFFACWAALASDWPFAKAAVERTYRLRAHLNLPEPDGSWTGPTHFNTRLSSPPHRDQWEWGQARDTFAALVTDEAACLTKLPNDTALKQAAGKRAADFAFHIRENPRSAPNRYLKNDEITGHPWKWRQWPSWNFPASINYGYEFYPQGAYARRRRLEQENSPFLKSPFQREENFVRHFGDAFTVVKTPSYSAIVHTGSVGAPGAQDGFHKYPGPYGFGGGQLSAFWTADSGAVLLGRRNGASGDTNFDLLEQWREWLQHAVSGCRTDGKVFTSSRILKPVVSRETREGQTVIHVEGVIPPEQLNQGKVLNGRLDYARTFTLRQDGVHVNTRVRGFGQDKLAELYETLPVFHYETAAQQERAALKIRFLVNGTWTPAASEPQENVSAVAVERFEGKVTITFDEPQRVRLAEKPWQGTYLSQASGRNVLIDLLRGPADGMVLNGECSVAYTVAVDSVN